MKTIVTTKVDLILKSPCMLCSMIHMTVKSLAFPGFCLQALVSSVWFLLVCLVGWLAWLFFFPFPVSREIISGSNRKVMHEDVSKRSFVSIFLDHLTINFNSHLL